MKPREVLRERSRSRRARQQREQVIAAREAAAEQRERALAVREAIAGLFWLAQLRVEDNRSREEQRSWGRTYREAM